MKHTLRYNPLPQWRSNINFNFYFFGLVDLCFELSNKLNISKPMTMVEIGCYKGESTSIFASSGIFEKITCIDPFEGDEEALTLLNDDWARVKKEYWTNTRHWDSINLIQDYSYKVVEAFKDNSLDFVYIDGSHEYLDVKKDIELYLPKCKKVIGGHDYDRKGNIEVCNAVDEVLGVPDKVFKDSSWIKYL